MSAIEDLTELAQRAVSADAIARSSKWADRGALQRKASELEGTLDEAAALLDRPRLRPPEPSPVWEDRARALLTDPASEPLEPAGPSGPARPSDGGTAAAPSEPARPSGGGTAVAPSGPARPSGGGTAGAPSGPSAPSEPAADARAAVAEADAEAAVNVARIALIRAYQAVIRARLAAVDAGDTASTDAAVRGLRAVSGSNPVAAHGRSLAQEVRAELRHIVRDRPRDIALRICISLGFGLAYLAVLRYLLWRQTVEHEFPYLALYAFSGIAGSMVCTNALCVDANRVRDKLLAGERLWHILVAKNLALGVIIGALGLVLNILVLTQTHDWAVFLKASGMFATMLLLWFGVGNVLSVAAPLMDEPLVRRPRDGTLFRYLISFGVAYGLSYAVNLMLYWRVWAKQTLLERFSSPWVPVLLVVGSALLTYVLFTVLALSLAQQSPRRRALAREMVDYRGPA